MPNLKELKNRISSVKSTRKITSAMKMVAASKLRRAQELAESSRVYADSLSFILSSLAGNTKNSADLPEILTGRENSKISLLIINSSDRGLCGGFNSNLFRNAKKWISDQQGQGKSVKIMTVGKKASSFYKKTDLDIVASFEDLNSNDRQLQVSEEIKNKIMELFENNEIDESKQLVEKSLLVLKETIQTQEPDNLEGKSLAIAIPFLADYVQTKYEVKLHFTLDDKVDSFNYELRTDVYKVIFEAIMSAIFKSEAKKFSLTLKEVKQKLWLTVNSDSDSFNQLNSKVNFDLASYTIRQICTKYHASLNTFNNDENSSQLVISFPLMVLN